MTALRPVRPVLLTLLLAGSLSVVGCEKRTDLADAIDSTSATMLTLGGGGRALPSAEVRQQKYDAIIRELKGAMSSGTASETDAAQQLLAQAHAGRAAVAMERALRADEEVVRLITRAHRLEGEREEFLSEARALRLYEQAPEGSRETRREADVAAIESQIEAREAQKGALERELAANTAARQTEIDEMESMLARAEEERGRENEIRAEAMEQGAVRRAELIREADEYRQRADAFEVAAMEAEVEAGRYVPLGAAIELRIAQATDQVAQLNAALERVQTRAEDLARQAREQESLAGERAQAVAEAVARIEAIRTEQLMPSYEAAISDHREAASMVKRAGTTGAGGVSAGGMTLAVAEAQDRYSASLDRLAHLYRSVADVPGVQVDGQEVARLATQVGSDAAQAWSDARDALQNARASGDVAERLNRIAERLPAMNRQEGADEAPSEEDMGGGMEGDMGDEAMDEAPTDDGGL